MTKRLAFSPARFWAIVVKEFIQMRRDRLTFGMMVGVPLIFGRLTADDYEDDVARDPRIDRLRAQMIVTENAGFSRDYLDPDKRAIGNAVTVHFSNGTSTERVAIGDP